MKVTKGIDDALFLIANPRLARWVPHGLQIQPNRAYRAKWLRDLDIEVILDIGANVGQAAINFCTTFPEARVHSFEPIPDCFAKLQRLTTAFDRLNVHNFALGDESGEVRFHQNEYTPSSSILTMSEEHLKSYPKATDTTLITVPIKRLDDIAAELGPFGRTLVKIDVQGYEKDVIAGGEQVIRDAEVVVVETSIRSLYDGDASFAELFALLSGLGFDYHGALEQLIDPDNGRVLQQDAIFVNAHRNGSDPS